MISGAAPSPQRGAPVHPAALLRALCSSRWALPASHPALLSAPHCSPALLASGPTWPPLTPSLPQASPHLPLCTEEGGPDPTEAPRPPHSGTKQTPVLEAISLLCGRGRAHLQAWLTSAGTL